ncbi:MAG: endopeptidase La [Candidatus Palauibacterales bacterium]|nr:endopeptidase La [Candidatus Palauibacterales bacterium]MDP2529932.1 endopeptidase La [Candidatus Palauibacterales bacterium]MDP2583352.1 endopeptidase La [Candidatus Palauibacterales bacterium]
MDPTGDEKQQIVFIPTGPESASGSGEDAGSQGAPSGSPLELSPEARLRLPVLPLRGTVVFPAVAAPIAAGREKTLSGVESALEGEKLVFAVAQKDSEVEEPVPTILHRVGTICRIAQMQRVPGGIQMVIQGEARAAALQYVERDGLIEVVCRRLMDMPPLDPEESAFTALYREVRERATELSRLRGVPSEIVNHLLGSVSSPSELADLVTFYTELDVDEKQALLETLSVEDRLRKLLVHLQRQIGVMEAQEQIRSKVQEELGERQREVFLREQMKAIQQELGEDTEAQEIADLRERLEQLDLSEEARKEVERELRRLERVNRESAEAQVIRTYLETVVDLPWNERTLDRLDLKRAQEILDRDHYGLEDVKERVLDFLAVRKLQQLRQEEAAAEEEAPPEGAGAGAAGAGEPAEGQAAEPETGGTGVPEQPETAAQASQSREGQDDDRTGSILLFVGPPGVGKTSIAKSIAEAMGREYVRVSLGGARDEADIRGHRRTYVGAMPGRIIEGMKRAGTKNPVFLLDEVDKLGVSFQGDPSAALMEVLDPAQNDAFVDHYLGVPFDLSDVLFIATANVLGQIPGPLQDRMEAIEFRGYTEAEKLQIARRYLLPRQVRQSGLTDEQLDLEDDAIRETIASYTREAGVRNLERELGTVARKAARKIAAGEADHVRVTREELREFLGQPKVHPEEKLEEDTVGVATGMYYTPAGGDIMLVETSVTRGNENLVLTGQLGDVMKESARAALTWARSHASELRIPEERLRDHEVHVHVPAGAVQKEGPSAGIAMAVSLISALGEHPVRSDVAMTGEITLTGRVLPIGGLKEKVLGAYRAGIRHILLPASNEGDLEDLPEQVREQVTFSLVHSLDEVVPKVFRGVGREDGQLVFRDGGAEDEASREEATVAAG